MFYDLVNKVLGDLSGKQYSDQKLTELLDQVRGKHTCYAKSATCKPGPVLEENRTSALMVNGELQFACLYHAQVYTTIEGGNFLHVPKALAAIMDELKRREDLANEQRQAVQRLHGIVRGHLARQDGKTEEQITDQMVMAKLAKMTEVQKAQLRELANSGRLETASDRTAGLRTADTKTNDGGNGHVDSDFRSGARQKTTSVRTN